MLEAPAVVAFSEAGDLAWSPPALADWEGAAAPGLQVSIQPSKRVATAQDEVTFTVVLRSPTKIWVSPLLTETRGIALDFRRDNRKRSDPPTPAAISPPGPPMTRDSMKLVDADHPYRVRLTGRYFTAYPKAGLYGVRAVIRLMRLNRPPSHSYANGYSDPAIVNVVPVGRSAQPDSR